MRDVIANQKTFSFMDDDEVWEGCSFGTEDAATTNEFNSDSAALPEPLTDSDLIVNSVSSVSTGSTSPHRQDNFADDDGFGFMGHG
jgi:hypothetical protein